jgi:hypothetical protein
MSWRDILWAFATMGLISFTYLALPSRFHFIKREWRDPAFIAMMTSVVIAFACKSVFLRNFVFWASLLASSAIHLVVVHALTQRVGHLNRGVGKGAAVLGFLFFLAVFGFLRLLQRIFNSEEILTPHSGDAHVPE